LALIGLAVVGTLWSDASWGEKLGAVGPTVKLIVLPALFYHFARSKRGMWVFVAFLASCTVLMVVSWVIVFYPDLTLKSSYNAARGIVVKNYIDQSQEFTLCAAALVYPIVRALQARNIGKAAILIAIVIGFIANMTFVIVSRTALVTMPIMVVVFALLYVKPRTAVMILVSTVAVAGSVWMASPQLRQTINSFFSEYSDYRSSNAVTSIGLRLEYLQKSIEFVADAPIIGHGTGSIRGLFVRAAVGNEDVASGAVVNNPHNQTLNVAVQWGMVGVVLLYAMWFVHLRLFFEKGPAAWIGLLVVIQNIFTSLFNSHLFDFVEGWIYVLGVGIAGGMTLRAGKPALQMSPTMNQSRDESREFAR
jgi:O-antigen ligase